MCFISSFLFANQIYPQSPCSVFYRFTDTLNFGCTYKFTPVFPTSHPCIAYLSWGISSSGTYKRECARINSDTLPFNYTFCFYGNQDITMWIRFCDSSSCYVTRTINVVCNGALFCNPDPGNDSIPDPLVEITCMGIDSSCGYMLEQGWHGTDCMSAARGGGYMYACSWKWAVRIVPSPYECEYFIYHMQWVDGRGTAGCDSICTYEQLTPGTVYCITAKINEGIVIWADENHCCLPDGYQRGFLWYPFPLSNGISVPNPGYDWGVCAAYLCPTSGNCDEDNIIMDHTYLPATHCLKGGGKKIEQRIYKALEVDTHLEQEVIIYNVHGQPIYKGNWTFGDPNNLNLNWPNGIISGLYIVKFLQYPQKGLVKLYKMN